MSQETHRSLEKDGYRAQLAVHADQRVLLRSRQGTDMTGSFPEIRAAALAQLPADTGLDGELVVWERDRLAFERLQQRLARRGTGPAEAARQWLAHCVAFDLVPRVQCCVPGEQEVLQGVQPERHDHDQYRQEQSNHDDDAS
ncbi:hypothetical protein ACFWHW_19075 [Streptomyces pharetrae]|uniref:ATP-dependent DNA ligase n=1 Tax=Streptomyces pharetrae TaxID=291370 RepID=UPI003666EB9E